MKVGFIGDVTDPLDEGMKKTAAFLTLSISNYCDILVLSPTDSLRPSFWVKLIKFHPEIIHYIPGPSVYSFVLAKVIKVLTGAKSVISLTHPNTLFLKTIFCKICKPDLIFYQSEKLGNTFRQLGCKTKYIPNGVDLSTFHPVSEEEKKLLRLKYKLPLDKQIILHVGNTRSVRNLEVLSTLQSCGYRVVVVSSTTISGDDKVEKQLIAGGCFILHGYIDHIEELYQLSDCYIFPTIQDSGAIQHPLSVMEAMACNLPVVTRKFGALTNIFESGDGLFFIDSDEGIIESLKEVSSERIPIKTRMKVETMDWSFIGSNIFQEYIQLLNVKKGNGR